ncbi:hypothetical protein SKAU_G00341220 [Synaphobranchus kaupii]|uniref:Uncharacterized protein n=1 Tax=Synaphobranchus kaupii TaxID=118154 RepID=A0A9Q1EN16_SYNKA|nr:hypothetical protein SKAU_G00341220 [Synaphobranchus kaupii]
MVRQNGELSLLDIRKEEIRWVEEGQSTREKVVNRPQDQGAVYTIVPAHQDGPVHRVHWMELRRAPRGEELDAQPGSPLHNVDDSVSAIAAMSDSKEESMMLVLEDDERTDPVVRTPGIENRGSPVQDQEIDPETSEGSPKPVSPLAPGLRRSTRSTAGFHSNPHRSPYRRITHGSPAQGGD